MFDVLRQEGEGSFRRVDVVIRILFKLCIVAVACWPGGRHVPP